MDMTLIQIFNFFYHCIEIKLINLYQIGQYTKSLSFCDYKYHYSFIITAEEFDQNQIPSWRTN